MIEKIPDQIPVQTGEWRGTTFDIIPKETFGMACRKINEIIDAVNELHEEAENNARIRANHEKLIDTLVTENNIHKRQIDELQMKLEPEKCETPAKNVQDEIDKAKREGRVIFPNPADIATALTKSLRMDKEFAEDECVRLQNKLERTRKALEIAVDALKDCEKILKADRKDWGYLTAKVALNQIEALAEISALEQKD